MKVEGRTSTTKLVARSTLIRHVPVTSSTTDEFEDSVRETLSRMRISTGLHRVFVSIGCDLVAGVSLNCQGLGR